MKGPREKPLGLDMPFDEALRRLVGTRPKELAENVEAAKKKPRPPTNVDGKQAEGTEKPRID